MSRQIGGTASQTGTLACVWAPLFFAVNSQMRLSWFTVAHLERRRLRARRRSAQASLRVRQLERRRVLDGAATTVIVSAVASPVTPTVASTTAPATLTTSTTA